MHHIQTQRLDALKRPGVVVSDLPVQRRLYGKQHVHSITKSNSTPASSSRNGILAAVSNGSTGWRIFDDMGEEVMSLLGNEHPFAEHATVSPPSRSCLVNCECRSLTFAHTVTRLQSPSLGSALGSLAGQTPKFLGLVHLAPLLHRLDRHIDFQTSDVKHLGRRV